MLIQSFKKLKSRIHDSLHHRIEIDVLLSQIPSPQSPLKQRTHWLFDLIDWIRREGTQPHDLDFTSGAPQAARVRYLLQILNRNLEWKLKSARTLRSIIQDTKGLELFIEIGLFSQDHFLGEFLGRLNEKWLPQVPRDHELSYIFSQNFHNQEDFEWIRLLDNHSFDQILELFHYEVRSTESHWNSLKSDAEQALLLLSVQVQGLGLSSDLRKRLSDSHFENSSFYQLPDLIELFVTEPDSLKKQALALRVVQKLLDCHRSLKEVQHYLDQHGVNIQVVYKIERLEHLLRRIHDLISLLQSNPVDSTMLSSFIENLIAESLNKRSLSSFFSQIFGLLSRKIVERNGETGEHYITRTRQEYVALFKSAIGGGILTSFTAVFKFLLHHLHFEGFFSGIVSSLNYSFSFLAIHFCHFTLGTKQPSSTAPALAAKMTAVDNPQTIRILVEEIVHIIRSQFAAILGNVIGVVPVTFFVCWIFHIGFKVPLLTVEESQKVIESFSIFGLTPIYAIFTGGLLWLSSLFSGWVENWFTYHQISQALAANRRMTFIFGARRAKTLSLFLRRNILGISSSLSLGFLLGLSPEVFEFFGVGIEVRHVTLSSGAMTSAIFSQPLSIVKSWDFWSSLLGIFSMGVLNVGVAFSLALMLAIKARQVQAPKRRLIYREVLKYLYQNPRRLFWPQKTEQKN